MVEIGEQCADGGLLVDWLEGIRVLTVDQVAHFLWLYEDLRSTERYLDLLPIFLRVGLFYEFYLFAVLAIDVFNGLEETWDHLLNVLLLDLRVVLDLLHEQPSKGWGKVLNVSLKIGNAVDGRGSYLCRLEVGDEYELVVYVPTQFSELK